MARTIKYWSVTISHVHRTSQFKLSRSRQYMPPYIGVRMIEVHRVHVKYMISCRDS